MTDGLTWDEPSTVTDDDRALCAELLPRVSRTFALSIEMLPDDLRDAVRVAYLLCRIVDTIEDDGRLSMSDKHVLFDLFEREMRDDAVRAGFFEAAARLTSLGLDDEHRLVVRAGATFRAFRALPESQRDAIRPHVLEMAQGMRAFGERSAPDGRLVLRDVPDLERYCYYVAGTVGNLLTDLFLAYAPSVSWATAQALRSRAVGFGLGLQLVNIVKDVAEDAERGVTFVPQSVLDAHHLTVPDLLDADRRADGLRAIGDLTALAQRHLATATEYLMSWPADVGVEVRRFCAVPLVLALATLTEVETGDDTLRVGRTPKITRGHLMDLVGRTMESVGDDRALTALLRAVGRPVDVSAAA